MESLITILPCCKPDREMKFGSNKTQSCENVSIFPAQCQGGPLGTEELLKMCDGAAPAGKFRPEISSGNQEYIHCCPKPWVWLKKHLPAWLPLLLGLTEERMERVGAQEFLLGAQEFLLGAQDASVLLLVGSIWIMELHKPVIFGLWGGVNSPIKALFISGPAKPVLIFGALLFSSRTPAAVCAGFMHPWG